MIRLSLTYYPDITQYETPEDVHDAVVLFANALGEKATARYGSEVQIDTLPVMSVPDQYEHIVRGDSQIALMKPVAYVLAHMRHPRIIPGAVARRIIDGEVRDTYFSQLFTRRDRGPKDLACIRPGELRIGYGSPFSTSNFLVGASTLYAAGIHPFTSFKSVHFLGGHDDVAKAVYEGVVDIGAGHDGVIHLLAQHVYPDAVDTLKTLVRTDIHSDPVVLRVVDPQLLAAIQRALIDVNDVPGVKAAIQKFWGNVAELGETRAQNYRSIETALQVLNLREKDLLA